MAQPKVSILISFYNLAPYVDKSCACGKKNIPISCVFL